MGLGSQRTGIEQADTVDTFRVRAVAPDILLFANLGAISSTTATRPISAAAPWR